MIPKILSSHKNDLKKRLESMPFEDARKKILQNELYAPDTPGQIYCLSWLESMQAALRDDREEETFKIAKEANELAQAANRIASDAASSARKQARWAMWAAIIATVAIIIAAMAYIKTP